MGKHHTLARRVAIDVEGQGHMSRDSFIGMGPGDNQQHTVMLDTCFEPAGPVGSILIDRPDKNSVPGRAAAMRPGSETALPRPTSRG